MIPVSRIFCWLTAVLVIAGASPTSVAAQKPNIILVMVDDVGAGDFSCLGNPIVKTPAIDAFYRESVRFTDFHVSPTCAPTRAALLTGRHEFRNGVTHTILERERLTLNARTLPEILRSAGYTTGIFGKWHLGDEPDRRPDRRGFEETFIHGGGGIGQTYAGSCGDAPGNSYFDPAILHNGVFVKTKGYCTDVFFRQAAAWIDTKKKTEQPFFCFLALNAAHAPLQVPEDYYKRHKGERNVSDLAAKFYGMIENIDDNFGALMGKLEQWKLATNTLVIFMSDNGGTVGVNLHNLGLRGGKNTPYAGGTRVPSFWRWPAGFNGDVDCQALAAHIDVLPTLAEICGMRMDERLQRQVEGRSLLPLLKNPATAWPERTLVTHVGRWPFGQAAESKYAGCSIRNSRFALVNNAELYDLKADPGQQRNVLEEHPTIVAELRHKYDRWWDEVLPCLENELVIGPPINPFKELYWKQFGGGPSEELRRQMNPEAKRKNQAVGK